MADSVGGRRITPVRAIDLQKPRDLAHLGTLEPCRRSRYRARSPGPLQYRANFILQELCRLDLWWLFRPTAGHNYGRTTIGEAYRRDDLLSSDKHRRSALRCELSQRAPIFDRHHLAEFWQIGLPVLKNAPGASRTGIARMVDDQLMQALGVESAHVAHHVDSAVVLEIAAGMQMALHDLFLGSDRIELHHCQITSLSERATLVEDVGDAARHASSEVAPRLADDHDDAAGHVFAAMVACALDDCDRAGIAHPEALTCHAAEIAFACGRAIKNGVADDDRGFRRQLSRFLGWVDDDAAARQALTDIIVRLSLELERHAFCEESSEALPRGALEFDVDRFITQAGIPVPPCYDARQHCSGRPIDVSNVKGETHMLAAFDSVFRIGDEVTVEHILEPVILSNASVNGVFRPRSRLEEQARKVESLRLGVLFELVLVQHLPLADHLIERAVAKFGHQRAHLFGDEEEIVDDMLRLAGKALAQNRVLRRDADRASVQMAFAHHDAAGGDQRRGGETELVRAQKRPDHHVAAGPHAAVDLHGDAGSEAVHHQRLMGLRETDLPGASRMFDRGQWRGAGPTLEARDRDVVGPALRNACCDRADTDLRHQF